MLTRGGEVPLFTRQHAELPLQPAERPPVTRRIGQPQSAREPRLRPGPLPLPQRGVAQPLARRDRARLVEFRLGKRERALEVARRVRVLPQGERQPPERPERLHLRAAVL